MNRLLKPVALTVISLLATHCPLLAAAPVVAEFSPELFPGLAGRSPEDIRLAGIAALNPGRLLSAEPKVVRPVVPESRRTRAAELPRGGAYLRLYTLDASSVGERAGKTPLVADCRYLATGPEDLDACLSLGGALAGGVPPKLAVRGDYPAPSLPAAGVAEPARAPVLVIVNRLTSGPLEAVLAALQADGKIFLIGGATAGETGVFKPVENHAGLWAISGEIFPVGGKSLVGAGVTPKFPVKVSPEEEFLSWQFVERGSPLAGVLRRDAIGRTESAAPTKDAENGNGRSAAHADATDPALQRAQDVLAALQVLGGVALSEKR